MESWSYAPEGKSLLFSDETDLSSDAFARSGKPLIGWDRESVGGMDFVDLGMLGVNDVAVDSSKIAVTSPCMIASNSSLESGLNHSNSLMESNSQDSSLIDLKLGTLADCKHVKNSKFSRERLALSSVTPTFQPKRARTVSSRTQTPLCQVFGCNKDLSSSKDYHKRHKVCEVHSKTPTVIVNGIEQRFCQQCSRFHLLGEFDDGKRSCRKRLAGHNERRRKPQFGTLSCKPHKFLQSYQGTKFLGTSLPKRSSFLFPNMLPGCSLYPDRYEQTNWCGHVKLEEKSTSTTNRQLLPKSFLHLCGNGTQCTSGISPSATEDCTNFNTASTIHELAGVWHSSRALSLLSDESQDLSHLAGTIMAKPLITQVSHAHHSVGVSDKLSGVGSLEKHMPNGFHSSRMNSIEINNMGSVMVSDAGHTADLQVEADVFLQDSDFLNAKCCVSPDRASTVDLLQLSSHLQRVEQQRNSMQVKHENEDFCSFHAAYGL